MRVLTYNINPFLDEAGNTRFIAINTRTSEPSICLSMYEHYLAISGGSPNSSNKELRQLANLYTWADGEGVYLDSILLNGTGVSEIQVRKFSAWLRTRKISNGGTLNASSYNSILNACARFCIWCGKWEANRPTGRNAGYINNLADEAIRLAWKSKAVRSRKLQLAPDLEESEIVALEQYLKPATAMARGISPSIAYRNHLMWRLAVEMGLRISEILALRLEDCPNFERDHISIVRIEERGRTYKDPRGVYAPRPKTLSRDLGFIINNSSLPMNLRDYISKYRYRQLESGGKQFMLEHNFLILAEDSGAPLALKSAEDVAKKISYESGVKGFHWHIARHAFFNRAYASVVDNQGHLNDLVYYGGWSDASSLKIYIQRALRNRAAKTLSVWQENNWEALSN